MNCLWQMVCGRKSGMAVALEWPPGITPPGAFVLAGWSGLAVLYLMSTVLTDLMAVNYN